MTNPLTDAWTSTYALPPFDQISDDDFAPAFEAGFAAGRAAHDAIATNPEAPSFENTIVAMEQADDLLNKVAGVFFNLSGADANPARDELQRTLAPQFSAYSSEIVNNKALFDRINTLWDQRDTLDLTAEQSRLLMLTHRSFVRAGAALEGEASEALTKVKSELASLGTSFSQNLLADEKSWSMPLSEEALESLPNFVADAACAAGEERGADGPLVTLSRSLIVPFLQFSPDRALRKRAYEAWTARGANGGDTDNREIAARTLKLREKRAQLLGYDTFSAFKLETEMAKTPEAVRDLLMSVWAPAKAAAEKDAGLLEEMLRDDGYEGPLEPWDWRYYAEARRKALHDLDEAELKAYFPLEGMIEASFSCAARLFGLAFKPLDIPLYHEDVRAWEVSRDGQPIAVFLGDYFARSSKRSGAWCSAMRSQSKLEGAELPIVVNVCNFAKGSPALLSYDDARTLFHEFGHALHQMLSDVTYPSISGTSVARDFVELPSQLYEHWLDVPDVLAEFARHAETGAPMPDDLRSRLLAASTYDTGFATVEYLASALVDLAFHDGPAPADPIQREAEVLAEIGMPRAIGMRHATPHFAHVFSGDGYSSGYYSYMWSEVMDADAFAAFEETGDPFDTETAEALQTHILSAGGSEDAAVLYTRFRGQMPGIEPLLKGRGLAA